MLIDTITLVLREALEAGTLIAILLSITKMRKLGTRWLWVGAILGSFFAYLYFKNFEAVTEWLDYSGQEVLNSSMQLIICCCLLGLAMWLIFESLFIKRLVPALLTVALVLLLTRELTEMIIFYTGFFQADGNWVNGITSGFIGLTIGASIGVLAYNAIIHWGRRTANRLQIILLSMVSAGLVVQALQLLMQVDWVSSTAAIWDSNWLIRESSILGQMAYAVFGYEATPTATEIAGYSFVIAFVLAMSVISRVIRLKKEPINAP